ncbi:hypothetical protein GobsT_31100 [Gemmata obscuriglobus]|uniref:Uncharacterized protein n=1 Tax=Gemmata obscuriglobus TaxID=114 RepID=A0A2Z3H1H8_9BACT|nr:hypothetical protein [Gemmata obscuriglobus]AWM38701.1 hypothetical protein C1280_18040 [Gemmata obscuriglobus]QEG28333.1 hypothetical protein GobsT_31100 [Gemmata obscuriglobus]VTS06203.1 unnamed protein product [Gemmata obscuriglobus UQM 2246]
MSRCSEVPQWIRELDAADQPVYADAFWVPDGFPAPIRPMPPGWRIVWIGANDEWERPRAEVWVRTTDGRFVASAWMERNNQWGDWRPLNV